MELVSVIIPTFGAKKSLVKALESVLNQDYQNIECLIVNDNPKESLAYFETIKMLNPYLKNPSVTLIDSIISGNGSRARNLGLNKAKGTFIQFLDDDDFLQKEKIALQVAQLNLNANYRVSYSSSLYQYKNQKKRLIKAKKKGDLFSLFLKRRLNINTNSLLFHKEDLIEINGFDESFKRHQDWELVARMSKNHLFIPCMKALNIVNYEPKNFSIIERIDFLDHYFKSLENKIETITNKELNKYKKIHYSEISLRYIKRFQWIRFIKFYMKFNLGLFGILYIIRFACKYVIDALRVF